MDYIVGQSFQARIPKSHKVRKVHITHILPSSCYTDSVLIIYKWYYKWWREDLCVTEDMDHYIEYAKKSKIISN